MYRVREGEEVLEKKKLFFVFVFLLLLQGETRRDNFFYKFILNRQFQQLFS
jgi:hypothetical protein